MKITARHIRLTIYISLAVVTILIAKLSPDSASYIIGACFIAAGNSYLSYRDQKPDSNEEIKEDHK